jgi:hypothetical protein
MMSSPEGWVKVPLPGCYYVDNYTLVDRPDKHFLKKYRYRIDYRGYVVRGTYEWPHYAYLHRDLLRDELIKYPPGMEVHHVGGDKRNNRRSTDFKILSPEAHRLLHAKERYESGSAIKHDNG